ncbi:MAG: DUF1015 family protein [Myxococcales bacterium]|nr:DUF1015 family protein [Myxococcales bacterium]
MLRLRPFAALRPPPDLAREVAAVPYDVVNTAEARALAVDNPRSFLHVTRPEIDLPDGTSAYDDRVYGAAHDALEHMVAEGSLVREGEPKLYLYRQQAELAGRRVSQLGIVGCCHIGDYEEERIKKHEITRKDKEDDRTRHVLTTRSNAGPVFLTYRPQAQLTALSQQAISNEPLYDFLAADEVRHTVWSIAPDVSDAIVAAFGQVDCAYVADGHHRSASAARAGAELRAKNPDHRGDEDYNYFLCVLFAADQLNVLPYHRLVRDLGGRSPEEVRQALAEVGQLSDGDAELPAQAGSFGVYLEGRWHRLTLPAASIGDDPVDSLDYVLLSERVLGPVMGIGDIRTDPRIDFVGGIRGTGELERRVDSGEHAIAFSLRATSVEQLMAVADAGRIMPPKSTWFEPKLRSGLLVHTF